MNNAKRKKKFYNIETKPSLLMLNAYLKIYLYTHLAGPFQCECHPLP